MSVRGRPAARPATRLRRHNQLRRSTDRQTPAAVAASRSRASIHTETAPYPLRTHNRGCGGSGGRHRGRAVHRTDPEQAGRVLQLRQGARDVRGALLSEQRVATAVHGKARGVLAAMVARRAHGGGHPSTTQAQDLTPRASTSVLFPIPGPACLRPFDALSRHGIHAQGVFWMYFLILRPLCPRGGFRLRGWAPSLTLPLVDTSPSCPRRPRGRA